MQVLIGAGFKKDRGTQPPSVFERICGYKKRSWSTGALACGGLPLSGYLLIAKFSKTQRTLAQP